MNSAFSTQHSAFSLLAFWANGRPRCRHGRRAFLKKATVALLFYCVASFAQEQNQPAHPEDPTITFNRYWEDATPQDYKITVKVSGEATYLSRNPTRIEQGEQAPDPDYTVEFTMSPGNRDRIFTFAKEASFFNGDFDYKHKVANTGKKTLMYADPAHSYQTAYNFSDNKNIQEITRLFEGISATIEHGRKLQFLRRFDKLSLDAELKSMEEMAQNGYLTEIQIIHPVLQNIVNDGTVLHMARQRAQRLLDLAGPSQ